MPAASILFYQSRSKPTWEEVAVEGQGRSDLVSKGGRGGAYMGCFSPPSPPSPTQPTDPTSLLPNHLFFPLNVVYTELGKRRRLHNHRVSFLPLHPIPPSLVTNYHARWLPNYTTWWFQLNHYSNYLSSSHLSLYPFLSVYLSFGYLYRLLSWNISLDIFILISISL